MADFKTPDSDALFVTPQDEEVVPETPKPGLLSRVWDKPIPVLAPIARGIKQEADRAQQEAGGAAEGAGASRMVRSLPSKPNLKVAGYDINPQSVAGAAAGLPAAAVSTGLEAAKDFIPAKAGDVVLIATTEGLGRIAKPLAKRVAPGLVSMFTEKPVTEVLGRAIESARKLGIPLGAEEVTNTPTFAALGRMLRKSPVTADVMAAFDHARAETLNAAKAKLLDNLGAAPGRGELGAMAGSQATAAFNREEAKRTAAYASRRAGVAGQYPAPDLPEARTAAVVAGATARKEAQKSVRREMYRYAESLVPPPETVQLPSRPILDTAAEVAKSFGTTEPKGNSAYNFAQRLLNNGVDKEALKAAEAGISTDMRALLTKKPELVKSLPEKTQQAWSLIQKASGQGQTTMTMLDMKSYLDQIDDSLAKLRVPGGGGDFSPEGRQLIRLRESVKNSLDSFYEQNVVRAQGLVDQAATALAKAGRKSGPELKAAQRELSNALEAQNAFGIADALHADYARTYRNAPSGPKNPVVQLFDKNPNGVVLSILRGGTPEDMTRLVKAVGPQAQPVVKRVLFDEVFGPAGEMPVIEDIMARTQQFGPAMRAILSPQERAEWVRFAKTGEEPRFMMSELEERARAMVMGKRDAEVANALLSGDVPTAKAILKFTNAQTREQARAQIAWEILSPQAGVPEAGNKGILSRLAKFQRNPEYLKVMGFTPQQIKGMENVGNASMLLPGFGDLAAKSPEVPNAALKLVGAAGAVASTATALAMKGQPEAALGAVIGSGALVIGQRQLAKMYTTESGQRMLTTLLKMTVDDPRLPKLLGRAAALGYVSVRKPVDGAGQAPLSRRVE